MRCEAQARENTKVEEIWRRGRDLNSRMSYPISGFQDQLEPISPDCSKAEKDEETRDRG